MTRSKTIWAVGIVTAAVAIALFTACGVDVTNVNNDNSDRASITLKNVLLTYAFVNTDGKLMRVSGEFATKVLIHRDSIVICRADDAGRVLKVDDTFKGLRWEPAPEKLVKQLEQKTKDKTKSN